jgi:serine/threonine-protein kinase RsbW
VSQATDVQLPATATLDEVGALGDALRAALVKAGVEEQFACDLELAVVEAVTNIIEHAFDAGAAGAVEAGLHIDDAAVTIDLTDRGRPFPKGLETAADFDDPGGLAALEESGRGLTLIALLVDAVERRRSRGVNRTRLTRKRPPRSEAPRSDDCTSE